MLICADPEFVSWRPDFSSSEQPSPHWSRLLCGGVELTNAINAVHWLDDEPDVQVELCECCGFPGCEPGGYVHVSRLGSYVFWTPPHIDASDPFESVWYRASDPVRRHGCVAIAVEDWEAWRRQFGELPSADEFPPTLRRDLLAAWRGEAPLFDRFDSPDELIEVARRRAVAADPSSLDDALAQLEVVDSWLKSDPDAAVEGALASASSASAAVETLYLDVPDTFDRGVLREWRASARIGDGITPVLGGGLVLLPAPS